VALSIGFGFGFGGWWAGAVWGSSMKGTLPPTHD
jgi:hypothetical protein